MTAFVDCICEEENVGLSLIPPKEEIFLAIKSIGAYKAPGPDGYQAVFYHRFWDIMGSSFCALI